MNEQRKRNPKGDAVTDKRCPKCGRANTRSSEANRLYWALLTDIAEKVRPGNSQYSPETWAHYFKLKYLGASELELPNGRTVTVPQTTTTLDVGDFNDYLTRIQAWAAHRGIYLEGE